MQRLLLIFLLLLMVAGPALAYDIEVTGMELNQTIQNLDNEMPLVLGRRIVVRAHAQETTGVPVADVSARINYSVHYTAIGGMGGGGYGGTFLAEADVLPGGADRTDYDGSFNFEVNPSIPDDIDPNIPATITVTVTVNPTGLDAESDDTNNEISVTRSLWLADELHIRYVPVHLHQPSPDTVTPVDPADPVIEHYFPANFSDDLQISVNALRWHPVALDDPGFTIAWENTPVFPANHNGGVEWNLRNGTDRTAVNSQLKALRDMSGWPTSWIIYGMVDTQAAAGSFAGWANNGVAWGVMNPGVSGASPWRLFGGDTLAHEIGHRRGLAHMPCAGNESSGGAVDNDYPWPQDPPWSQCSLAEVDPDGYYGLETYPEFYSYDGPIVISNDPSIAQPNRGYPLMGYRSPRWISPYEYCKLLPQYGVPCNIQWPDPPGVGPGGIVAGSGSGVDPSPTIDSLLGSEEIVWVGGVLDFDFDQVTGLPSYSFGGGAARLDEDVLQGAIMRRRDDAQIGFDTGWSLEVLDARGRSLHRQAIVAATPNGESCGLPHDDADITHEHLNILSIAEVLPLPPGSERVVYRNREGRIVEQLERSAHAPTVDVTAAPQAGSTLQSAVTFQWSGRDRDGDGLTYTLRASNDGGKTWTVLALNTAETQHTLDQAALDGLPGGSTLVQVLVTDGLRSGVVEVGPFQVPNKAPIVTILEAQSELDQVTLRGFATDKEDGTLGDVAWSSDLDGHLGIGTHLSLESSQLTPGSHKITLRAEDSAGESASARVEILVIGTLDPATQASLKPSDMISQEDIDSSPDGYLLEVPDVGDVYVTAIRSADEERECLVHKDSLIDALTTDPPGPLEAKWLNLTIYSCPYDTSKTCCLAPLGGSCYALIKKRTP